MEWGNIIFGAFGIATMPLIWEAVKYFTERKDKLTPKNFDVKQKDIEILFQKILTGTVQIQENLEKFISIYNNCERILLIKLHNGGGIPQLGSEQKITIINECLAEKIDMSPLKNDIQNFNIDGSYQKLLMDMIQNKIINKKTTEIDSGLLRTLLLSEHINQITLAHITNIPDVADTQKGFLVFLSFKFKEEFEITPEYEGSVLILIQKIKNIFNNFYKNI